MDQTLILNKILEQQNLNIEESMYIFNKIMGGELDDVLCLIKSDDPSTSTISQLDDLQVSLHRLRAIFRAGTEFFP